MESNFMLSIYFILILISHLFHTDLASPVNNKISGNIELQIAFIKKNVKNDSCLDARILIINNTDTVASFFEDWNSWGWFNIYLKIKIPGSIYTIYKTDRDWTKNFPSYKTLFPGDTLELKYLLSYGACDSSQFNKILLRNLKDPISMQATYQLPKAALEEDPVLIDFIKGEIKYREKWINGRGIFTDSLKTPVEVKRTFVTSNYNQKNIHLQTSLLFIYSFHIFVS